MGERCGHLRPDGSSCRAWALKAADPDGKRRCRNHSERPEAKDLLAARQRAAGEGAKRRAAKNDVTRQGLELLPGEGVRAKAKAKRRPEDFLEVLSGSTLETEDEVLEAMQQIALGAALGVIHPSGASAAASMLRGMLSILKERRPEPEAERVAPEYVAARA